MLDQDQPDSTTSTGSGETTPAQEAPAPPVVTRRTRSSSARKTAAATPAQTPAPDAPAPDGTGETTEVAAPAKKAAKRAPAKKAAAKRTAAKKTAATAEAPPADVAVDAPVDVPVTDGAAEVAAPAKKAAKRAPARKSAAKKTAAPAAAEATDSGADSGTDSATGHAVLFQAPVVTTTRRTRKKAASAPAASDDVAAEQAPAAAEAPADVADEPQAPRTTVTRSSRRTRKSAAAPVEAAEQTDAATADAETTAAAAPDAETSQDAPAGGSRSRTRSGSRTRKKSGARASDATESPAEDVDPLALVAEEDEDELVADATTDEATDEAGDEQAEESGDVAEDETDQSDDEDADGEDGPARRRRRRGGRRRRKSSDGAGDSGAESADGSEQSDGSGRSEGEAGEDADASIGSGPEQSDGNDASGDGSSRRRRRRRRAGDDGGSDDDEPNTVTRVRKTRSAEDQITSVQGSTRLEAKKQRRREGREAGRRRAPIVSEAEFLARRESVDRVMVIRQRADLIQIGVLEDRVLVEHYVARESQTSLIGNVYLGRVQNVLPSMEAAFIDIGKGRNAVLYAGEVNWSSLGHKEGQPRKIESVLSSGQMVLVQVTKDPVGHKGARLTSQVSLAGRFLVYVPDGTTSGISRKLPDTERGRLKSLLKEIVPDTAGVIVRTAAEGASEEELTHDVERLKSRWEEIEKKATNKGSGPQMLYGEPDLTLKVVRDLFTEDFSKLVIEGDDAWDTVYGYVQSVAPDLADRVERYERNGAGDVFATYRIDEQIHKGLDRKVWLPSGGSLIIDRTEAMTVVDVNTGKFTGSGGNLEETVTKNNLEAAEEIVRQLRLRDIGGIIVVDFIDMVLESNRDLVVRRLVECLGRDRTRHQVAEVTSLGLVQMTRKRIGTGLLEAFSENCEHCHGRGVVIKDQPVDPEAKSEEGEGRRTSRRRGRRTGAEAGGDQRAEQSGSASGSAPSPKDVAAMARHERAAEDDQVDLDPADDQVDDQLEDLAPDHADEVAVDDSASEDAAVEQVPPAEAPVEDAPVAAEPPAEVPTEQATDAPGTAEEAAEGPADAAAPVEEPAAPEAPVAEKPRVVTRTRRRAASRPAGPPALLESRTTGGVTSGVAGTRPETGAVEPGTAELEPGAVAVDGEASEASLVEHVPIKKKGSRKR